jgi:sirohydrochlorin cobaltochelatase
MLQAIHLLITHGSRHPRSQQSSEQLRRRISDCLNSDCLNPVGLDQADLDLEHVASNTGIHHRVEHATLEGASIPLHAQILNCASQARAEGLDRLQLLPLFLLPGVHVMDDLPQEVALAQQQLADRDPSFKISTLPYLGYQLQHHPHGLQEEWGDGSQTASQQAKIMLSHGSSRSDSVSLTERFAASIGAVPAYWSIEPSLSQTVERLFTEGYEEIQILLYFLFSGGITDAIEASIADLKVAHPHLKLTCESTLDQRSEFPQFIAHLLSSSTFPRNLLSPHLPYAEVAR